MIAAGETSWVMDYFQRHPERIHLRNMEAIRPDSPAWNELTPLHAAAKHGDLPLVRFLVEQGAEVYSNPWSTYPAVIVAAWEGHTDIVEYFLEEIPERAEGTNGLGVAANLAAREGWEDLVRRHLEIDPLAVHQRGWIGDTPLHWPAHNGFSAIVDLLLDAGADPNAHVLNWAGGTPVHWASERHADIVRRLVAAGGDVNARVVRHDSSHLGATPLIWCAKQPEDCVPAAEMLLSLGADPTLTDATGKRAIDYARPGIHALLSAL